MIERIPLSRNDDAALAAVRALVEVAPTPLAVYSADGERLAANRAFLEAASLGAVQQHIPFSPDAATAWTLVTLSAGADWRLAAIGAADAMPILFNATDTNGRFIFMNRYQASLYGTTPADAIGRTAAELIGTRSNGLNRSLDDDVIRTAAAVPFYEERFTGADGVPRNWLTAKAPLPGSSGDVLGVATIAVDITERMQLEEKLREAKEQAEVGSRAKSRFLGTMSHELRTPLNAVIGFAELMHEEALGPLGHPEYREYAGLILRSGMNLLDMISNLLDFARAEAGSLELNITDVELGRLLRGLLTRAREQVAAGPTRGQVTLEADLPATMLALRADEQRLRQVLRGLIDNAVKFTPAGGRVTVAARAIVGGGAEVVVTDSGIGMSPDDLEHVFEPFWQADSSLGRARDGAGIGLKLARQLVTLHGGTIEMESARGSGTRVVLRLPHAPPGGERPAA